MKVLEKTSFDDGRRLELLVLLLLLYNVLIATAVQ
jgi:hypothetical protein